MPGMAADPSIFEYIQLPKDQFKIHLLIWIIPRKNEDIAAYAKRMSEKIKHDNSVLLGVSFGGILVQEMSHFLNLRKLIIVSSVKARKELPKRFNVMRNTGAYKLLPTRFFGNVDALAKYAFGESITKRIELYRKYLSMNDPVYLNWAIKEMVCWNEVKPCPYEIIHIHGDKDAIFPIRNIKNCIHIHGGTHIMIISKHKWFSENLPKLILS
jgi:alpha/beta superfamily hydrolase